MTTAPTSAPGLRRPAPAQPGRGWPAIAAFCAITFTVTFTSWFLLAGIGGNPTRGWRLGLYLLGGFGPTIGMLALRFVVLRHPAPRLPGRRLSPPLWLAVSTLLGAAPVALAVLVAAPFGEGPHRASAAAVVTATGGVLAFAVSYLIAGPLSEELGWEGFLYPHLRRRLTRLPAVAVLGTLWNLWHLPLFFIDDTPQQANATVAGVLFFVVSSYLQVYLFSAVNQLGGVLAAVTAHYAYNVASVLLELDGPVENTAYLVLTAVACLAIHPSTAVWTRRANLPSF